MKKLRQEEMLCPCCMERHMVDVVEQQECNLFKGAPVEYPAAYYYCAAADEIFQSEEMLDASDKAMKDAFRRKTGRLTSDKIVALRRKYRVSQTDLAIVLGWGKKTIARYEGHQVQDEAHDTILRKLEQDPEWFLELLGRARDKLSQEAYQKYSGTARSLFHENSDAYLMKSLAAQYTGISRNPDACGNNSLNVDKIVDAIQYFASSAKMSRLYLVRLWKMLWYSDALSFKRCGRSITGLAYQALPMGAVPVGGKQILALSGVEYTEVEFEESTGFLFTPVEHYRPSVLSGQDVDSLETVLNVFQGVPTCELVRKMHSEEAYQKTAGYGIISYRFAEFLSIG